jgi:hypothetical protein
LLGKTELVEDSGYASLCWEFEGDDGKRDGGGDRGICDLVEEIAWTASPGFDEIREKRIAESERSRTYPT